MGAIGIARCFGYGCQLKNTINGSDNSCVSHFYEKLLILKNYMITDKGKEISLIRHNKLVTYLLWLKIEEI
jgi:uncharacterized protein